MKTPPAAVSACPTGTPAVRLRADTPLGGVSAMLISQGKRLPQIGLPDPGVAQQRSAFPLQGHGSGFENIRIVGREKRG